MTYKLVFKIQAKKEWDKLNTTIREQLIKKKLAEHIKEPIIESSRLSGMQDCYKIKFRSAGYRLIYQVRDNELVVAVVAVGKRERNAAYKAAIKQV